MGDPYTYPGSDVLRNKANIRDKDRLFQFEHRKSAERSIALQTAPIAGRFDLSHLQAIHKYLFQDVYDWAGQNRTTNISKGSSLFAAPDMIDGYARSTVFKGIEDDHYLENMEKNVFAARLAYHYSEINALHPFREGNGRSTRHFITQLAKHAGYDLDYAKVGQAEWNAAARESFMGELESMTQIFRTISQPVTAMKIERNVAVDLLANVPQRVKAEAAQRNVSGRRPRRR
jgi:cell filamentation protein